MMGGVSVQRNFAFGPFRLDADQQRLLRDGQPVSLPPKAFDLLVAFAECPGELLHKDDLLKRVWPDSFVEEANLSYNVSIIRKALADGQGGWHFIETVPKRGYRFVAEMLSASDDVVVRLAVLPFVNEGQAPETDYLSDGLAESLIDSLSCLFGLRVIAKSTAFRYKGKTNKSLREIGEELRVSVLLTGTVSQREDTTIVHVELVDTSSETRIWGESYRSSSSNMASVPAQVSTIVARKLGLRLSDKDARQLSRWQAMNAEAHQLYLTGNYLLRRGTGDDAKNAIERFNRAIAIEPAHAPSYFGLAHGYICLSDWHSPSHDAMPRARAAARKALELDDMFSSAHLALATVLFAYDWDFAGAASHYARAIALSPHDPETHHFYGWYLNAMGRCDDAIAEMARGQLLDPLNRNAYTNLGLAWYFARDYDRAVEQYQMANELEPDWFWSHYLLGLAYEQQGRLDDAIAELTLARRFNDSAAITAALGHAHGVAGRVEDAMTVLGELDAMTQRAYVSPYEVALVYAGLRDQDRACGWLDRACQDRCGMLGSWVKVDPRFDALRTDVRFGALLRCIGISA
jgi:DNA-binding winged helix-turn-helix (wHTH) protein/tetratricopeptide (TPR) repeat protein